MPSLFFFFTFFFYRYGAHSALPPFPTRRSSDLGLVLGGFTDLSYDIYLTRPAPPDAAPGDRKSTRQNSSHQAFSYAVNCLKKKDKPIKSHLGGVLPHGRNR